MSITCRSRRDSAGVEAEAADVSFSVLAVIAWQSWDSGSRQSSPLSNPSVLKIQHAAGFVNRELFRASRDPSLAAHSFPLSRSGGPSTGYPEESAVAEMKTRETEASVDAFLDKADPKTRRECETVMKIMQR